MLPALNDLNQDGMGAWSISDKVRYTVVIFRVSNAEIVAFSNRTFEDEMSAKAAARDISNRFDASYEAQTGDIDTEFVAMPVRLRKSIE